MADYLRKDVARAEEVFGRLLTPQRAEDDLPLFDVENDIRNFLQELSTLQNAGFGRVPVMRLGDGDSAPVSLAFASIKRTEKARIFQSWR